jgi:hypothetical protein
MPLRVVSALRRFTILFSEGEGTRLEFASLRVCGMLCGTLIHRFIFGLSIAFDIGGNERLNSLVASMVSNAGPAVRFIGDEHRRTIPHLGPRASDGSDRNCANDKRGKIRY